MLLFYCSCLWYQSGLAVSAKRCFYHDKTKFVPFLQKQVSAISAALFGSNSTLSRLKAFGKKRENKIPRKISHSTVYGWYNYQILCQYWSVVEYLTYVIHDRTLKQWYMWIYFQVYNNMSCFEGMWVRVTELIYSFIKYLVDSDLCLSAIIHGIGKNLNYCGQTVLIMYMFTH